MAWQGSSLCIVGTSCGLVPADNTKNACHGSDAAETAAQEAAFFFGED